MYYPTVSTDDVLSNTNNETAFTKIIRVFEEAFDIKVRDRYILKYLNLQVYQSPLGLRFDQTDHTMELVNEWFPNGKFRKFDTTFRKEST